MSADADDIIIHPVKTGRERGLPAPGLLVATPKEAKTALAAMLNSGGERRHLHYSGLAVAGERKKFAAGPVLGAPAAVLALEKLIVLGARRIVFYGWCGAVSSHLKVGDIVVPDGVESGEGTSAYYPGPDDSRLCRDLRRKLCGLLSDHGLAWSAGSIWSTDAPYRESRSRLAELQRHSGVVGVDMELAALAAVAAFRGVALAGVLVVSDELFRQSWRPGFKEPVFQRCCDRVLACLLAEDF